jgi:hypothetical protein
VIAADAPAPDLAELVRNAATSRRKGARL